VCKNNAHTLAVAACTRSAGETPPSLLFCRARACCCSRSATTSLSTLLPRRSFSLPHRLSRTAARTKNARATAPENGMETPSTRPAPLPSASSAAGGGATDFAVYSGAVCRAALGLARARVPASFCAHSASAAASAVARLDAMTRGSMRRPMSGGVDGGSGRGGRGVITWSSASSEEPGNMVLNRSSRATSTARSVSVRPPFWRASAKPEPSFW
jgi:hypothetical protein